MKIVYAPRALRDLRSIAAYSTNPAARANILGAIKSSIDTLSFFPRVGRIVDGMAHRRLAVLRYPYLVFYRIEDDELLILHIQHTSRRPIDPASEL